MSEKLQHSSEKLAPAERATSPEHRERIKSLETQGEHDAKEQEKQLEVSREEVETLSHQQQEAHLPKTEQEQHVFSPATKSNQKKLAFKQTMKRTQAELSPASRSFSKVIHQPVIEKTSEIASKTVFRPSLTLGAALGALIGGSLFYGLARYYGFSLSGFEFIFCALIGGVVGLIWEFAGFLAKKALGKKVSTS